MPLRCWPIASNRWKRLQRWYYHWIKCLYWGVSEDSNEQIFGKRGVAAPLCLCLMLSVMPRVQAAQGSGSFYFCVMTANRVIVEPEAISHRRADRGGGNCCFRARAGAD